MKKQLTAIVLFITASLFANTAFAQTASDKPAPASPVSKVPGSQQAKITSSQMMPLVSSAPATSETTAEKRLPVITRADSTVLASEKALKPVQWKEAP